MNKNKGISLIVLIITIVVIIILATAIIVNLAQTNITKNAEFAAFVSEYNTVKEAEFLYESESLLKEPYVKEYAVTSEKVVPSENLQKMLEQIYGNKSIVATSEVTGDVIEDVSGAELYKVDLEKLNIKNTKYEYALNIDDGMLFLTEGHAKGKELYFTPEHKITDAQEVVKDTTPPNDFNISAVFDSEKEQIQINALDVKDDTSTNLKYEYYIQKVNVDETTGVVTETVGDQEKYTSNENVYYYNPAENGNYQVSVIVYDERDNSKESTNKVVVNVNLVTIHVSVNGNDTTGNGSRANPYATVKKAVEVAVDGDKILIGAGEYTLTPLACPTAEWTGYGTAGIYDYGKKLEIYGENEKTVLTFDGSTGSVRDSAAICMTNTESVVRNLVYVFKPKSSADSYAKAIFYSNSGITENVFFRIIGSNAAAYSAYSNTFYVKNCTFHHDLGYIITNGTTGKYSNIATNVTTSGSNTNVIIEKYSTSIAKPADVQYVYPFIKLSNENEAFNTNQVGVYYGEHAWNKENKYLLDIPSITVESANIASSGITLTNEVSIKSSNEKATGILYKVDDAEWQNYTDKFNINVGSKVYAKYKFGDEIGLNYAQIDENILDITSDAIDNNPDTKMLIQHGLNRATSGSNNIMYLNIEQEVIGKTFNINWFCWNFSGYIARIHLLDENKNIIHEDIATVSGGNTELDSFVIPQGTKYMKFVFICSDPGWGNNNIIYDMYITD